MKKITIIFASAALLALCMLQSCAKKEEPSWVAKIGYPTVTLKGAPFITIARGATFSDPGASWTDSVTGESGNITVSIANTGVDSAYVLVYKATDKNGFSSFVVRGVGVTNNVDTADLSGNYVCTVNGYYAGFVGAVDSVQKVAKALYMIPGIDGLDMDVFVIKTDGTISIASIIEQGLTAPGANLLETFTGASLSYAGNSQPYTFGANATITNVPPYAIQFAHE
jgi:hypothetical protein